MPLPITILNPRLLGKSLRNDCLFTKEKVKVTGKRSDAGNNRTSDAKNTSKECI